MDRIEKGLMDFDSTLGCYLKIVHVGNNQWLSVPIGEDRLFTILRRFATEYSVFEELEATKPEEDGTLLLSDSAAEKSKRIWVNSMGNGFYGFTDETLYNLSVMYSFLLNNTELIGKMFCGIDLSFIVFQILMEANLKTKLTNPFSLFNYCAEWIMDHSDFVEPAMKKSRHSVREQVIMALSENIRNLKD